MNARTLYRWIAAALAAAGVVATLLSVRALPADAGRLEQKVSDLGRLQALRDARSENGGAVQRYEQLPSKQAVPLDDLAGRILPGSRPSVRTRDYAAAGAGWVAHSVEVSFENARLADAARFAEEAENSRPPWRLLECSIAASGPAPGYGRVSMVMEALEGSAAGR